MTSDWTKLNQTCPELKNIENWEVQYNFSHQEAYLFVFFFFFFFLNLGPKPTRPRMLNIEKNWNGLTYIMSNNLSDLLGYMYYKELSTNKIQTEM